MVDRITRVTVEHTARVIVLGIAITVLLSNSEVLSITTAGVDLLANEEILLELLKHVLEHSKTKAKADPLPTQASGIFSK